MLSIIKDRDFMPEDVVNKKQHILALLVTEVLPKKLARCQMYKWKMSTYLSDSQTCKSDTGTSTRGLVHLTEDKGDLGVTVKLNDGGLLHFLVQIVTLTGTLANTSEDGETTVGLGDVVNQLLNEHSLADTSTSEKTNLSSTSVGGEKVDNLDTSDEHLSRGGLLDELRRVGVDRSHLGGLDGTTLIDGVTSDVHDATKSTAAYGNHDGSTSVRGLGASDKTLGT